MNPDTRQIARQRITILFQQARKVSRENPQLAKRYVETARKIAMAARIRMPAEYKRLICKNCNSMFIQGDNCRVRTTSKRTPHTVTTCLSCGYIARIPLKLRKEMTQLEQNIKQNETSR